VGLLLGFLQSGLFFLLTFTLSAGFATYLLITLCWLMGGIFGVVYVKRLKVSLRSLLILMLFSYILCGWVAESSPFNTRIWVFYGCLIACAGIYPGVFFARASNFYAAHVLFFWENNGFIAGVVISTLSFMVLGRAALWTLPTLCAVFVWLRSPLPLSRTSRSTVGYHVPNKMNAVDSHS
jgi:hypothetical protein